MWQVKADSMLCMAFPSLARYTIDAFLPISGEVYQMDTVHLRSGRNAAVLCVHFLAEAQEKLGDTTPAEDLPNYRVRRL